THVFMSSGDSFAATPAEAIVRSSFALALNEHQLIDRAPTMPKKNSAKRTGAYQISNGPVTSSSRPDRVVDTVGEMPLPAHYGMPLLLAIARDARTVLVCWRVGWWLAFAHGVQADRRGRLLF